jgi:hypothetical protein
MGGREKRETHDAVVRGEDAGDFCAETGGARGYEDDLWSVGCHGGWNFVFRSRYGRRGVEGSLEVRGSG